MTDYLLLIFIFLFAGVIAVPIASHFKLGSVLGYLIAGIAISPILSLLLVDVESLQHIAEFGVVMMLFLVGLELEPRLLWQMRMRLLGLGGFQVLLTTVLVMGAAILFGLAWPVALAIGLVFSLSSTAIVLQTLNEKGLMQSDGGKGSFSVLLFQDIAVIPMLALLPLLALPSLTGSLDHSAVLMSDTAVHNPGMSLVAGLNAWQKALVTIAAIATVIFAGHGRVGGVANRMLRSAGFDTTVIDFSPSNLDMLRAFKMEVYYGDATRPDLLHAAGIEEADILVIAIDKKEHITEIAKYICKSYPHIHVIARAVDRHHVYDLWAVGCRDIIRETFDSSLRIGRSALISLGMSEEKTLQISTLFEEIDRSFMREMADLYDPDIPPQENAPYVAKVIELNEEWARQIQNKTFVGKNDSLSPDDIKKLEEIQLSSPTNG